MKRIVGPNETRTLSHQATLPVSGLALTTTSSFSSRSESDFVSAKDGISVENWVDGLEPA